MIPVYKPWDEIYHRSRRINTNYFQPVKSFIPNHGSHVEWLSNVSLFIAIAVDTSEMRFLEEKRLPSA